ncbi:conserved hypothetical protein [uncultured Desulfobacterium sp.]|uniref:Pyridoxamine 5'-phosphate oxidase N-terminal domain-containing protein n=1 Tax=uncultured Desulfobacterium sp. TaxID=201089 RepID=A0A445MV47_9BACT|nr:conserved hypothetical protein [uncultured Desulfobacterium sp.]
MREDIKQMIRQKDMCVMATVSGTKPHCSLMSYVPDDECLEIFMVTHKNTTKYRNMLENPSVSLLIDDRDENSAGNRKNSKALTISGVSQMIDILSKKKRAAGRLLERHPHLSVFIDDPGAEIFCVKPISFLLLDGLTKPYFENA